MPKKREEVYTGRRMRRTEKPPEAAGSVRGKSETAGTDSRGSGKKEKSRLRPEHMTDVRKAAKQVNRNPGQARGGVTAVELASLIRRKPDFPVVLIAVLTAVFETLGLMLAAAHTQQTVGMDSVAMIAVIVPLGLFTSLILPRFLRMDALIMALTNFLCGVGIVTLCTVSPLRGNRQILSYALSLGGMVIACLAVTHLNRYHGVTIFLMIAGIGILVLPLIYGQWNNGAKNWVSMPLLGSFQPSELVKISAVFALAYYFSAHRTLIQMMPALLFSGVCLLILMLQRDLGTALIYYLSTLTVFYVACGNIPLTMLGAVGGVGAAVMGYRMFAHVKVRVAMWRNPWSDPTGGGYQIIQALLAISSGGLFGMGLGQGTPEKIPAYYNDFIFAVICEQFGQIFGVLLLAVYALLLLRTVMLSSRSRHSLTMLLGYGTAAMLGIQTFMITAGVIKLVPLTGVTMPFLSYGGSSLLSCMTMIGIVHGIAGRAQMEAEDGILLKGGIRN
ncbi:MAG: FtsW/RodA/SpoVE family cell cycle protein [Clostridia bacterium]|nr:FtsW/RodA/SpoVE family cell cycle protein [Clostridia bacterium]